MIDTLSIAKELQDAGLSKKEAFAIAGSIGRIMQSELASKKDVEVLRIESKEGIEHLRFEFKNDLEHLRFEFKKDMQILKAELQKEIHESKAELQKDIREVSSNSLKRVAGFMVGQTALLFTLVKLIN